MQRQGRLPFGVGPAHRADLRGIRQIIGVGLGGGWLHQIDDALNVELVKRAVHVLGRLAAAATVNFVGFIGFIGFVVV